MTPGIFWTVTLGDRMLFLQHVDRCSEEQALAELTYWSGLLGTSVRLERMDTGEDTAIAQMALAIHSLAPDGVRVNVRQLEALGWSKEQIARCFTRALRLVTSSYEPKPFPSGGPNVIPFPKAARR